MAFPMPNRNNALFSIVFSVIKTFHNGVFKNLDGSHKVDAVFRKVALPLLVISFKRHT